MARLEVLGADQWYETVAKGDDVTLIHEPAIKPFYRCNMWHVQGQNRTCPKNGGNAGTR